MKAKEASEKFNQTPHMTAQEIIKMMDNYGNVLHRNQWIATFLKHIKPEFSKIGDEIKEIFKPKK